VYCLQTFDNWNEIEGVSLTLCGTDVAAIVVILAPFTYCVVNRTYRLTANGSYHHLPHPAAATAAAAAANCADILHQKLNPPNALQDALCLSRMK